MALSVVQLAVLRLVYQRRVSAFYDGSVWRFRDDNGDAINRRTIKALESAGVLEIGYYRHGAGVSLTEEGRQRMAQWDRNRR